MKKVNTIFILIYMLLLTSCFIIPDQKLNSSAIGYKEIKNKNNDYQLHYYGKKEDEYADMVLLWHKRAIELCESYNYYSELTAGKANELTVLFSSTPPIVSNPDSMIPYIQGRLRCSQRRMRCIQDRSHRFRKKY